MEKGQPWLTLKWAMIYNRGVWFYNLEDKIFSLPFWILNHNFFVLLYLGCSCRTGVCILSSTESTNSTNHTSNQQARNFTSVANSMFENLEGNFKTKQICTKWSKAQFQNKKENFASVRLMVEWRLSWRKVPALFTSWAHGSLAPGCSAYLYQMICAEQQQSG